MMVEMLSGSVVKAIRTDAPLTLTVEILTEAGFLQAAGEFTQRPGERGELRGINYAGAFQARLILLLEHMLAASEAA